MVRGLVGAALTASQGDRNPGPLVLFVGGGGIAALVVGVRMWRRRWAILDTPSSKCVAVFVGRNEVVGRADLAPPATAPVTGRPAVWFRYLLEKYVRRGKSSRWETVDEILSTTPFWVVDDTGRVLIRPEGAEIHAPRVFRSRAPDSGVTHLHYEGRPLAALGRKYRVSEWRIDPGQQLYVLGSASPRDDAVALEFADGGRADRLLISTHSENRMAGASLFLAVVGLLGAWAAIVLVPATIYNTLTWRSAGPEPGSRSTVEAVGTWMLMLGVGFGVALFVAYWLRVYNRLVAVKQQAANAWSLIDVALRRRHDLLPALATVAEAYARHEREILERVARERADVTLPPQEELPSDASLQQAGDLNQRERAGSRALLALAESYPDLQADEVFQDLAQRIVDTENQVASARGFYNDAVTVLRDRRRTFPGILVAGAVRTPSWQLFDADDAATAATASELLPDR